ncbi:MAG: hypothetical protein SRB2_03079 [Desulfobacteraceae bacterium Eth-SRB2]|nr:MAG: hypothetical protein SRB2_03079 [Desulfobacteraceae bacterium Eth-SRB2]
MCECKKASEEGKKKSDCKVDGIKKDCPLTGKIEIIKIKVTVDAADNKAIMDDPSKKVVVKAVVTYKDSSAADALDTLPPKVAFTFSDPASDNTAKTDSYKYTASDYLGKKNDADALHWEQHPGFAASTTDGYKTNGKAALKVIGETKTAESKIYFIPSGVGGDDFKIRTAVHKPGGAVELVHDESDTLTVWRSVTFDKIYEMDGETHVSTNATTVKISPVFNPAFVKYSAGMRNPLDASKSVKYIGLWKDNATPQESWATIQAKKADETPTAQEMTDAKYAGANDVLVSKRNTARNKIIAKAQKWADRIDSAFVTARDKWVTDASIPGNALVGIRYYHPKYSDGGGNHQTNEWKLGEASVPAWLRVGAFAKSGGGHHYTNLDPDGLWAGWVGLSHGNGIVTIPKGRPAPATTQTIRHEAGHATKHTFKREVFGPSLDHSASNTGIMYYSSAMGGTTFSAREKKILRGINP